MGISADLVAAYEVHPRLDADKHPNRWRPADAAPVSLSRGRQPVMDADYVAVSRLDELEAQGERNEVDNALNAAGVPRAGVGGRMLTQAERVRVLAAWARR